MLHDFGASCSPECVRLLLRGSAERFHATPAGNERLCAASSALRYQRRTDGPTGVPLLGCQLVGEGATPPHSASSNLRTPHQPFSPVTHLVVAAVIGASEAVQRPSDADSTLTIAERSALCLFLLIFRQPYIAVLEMFGIVWKCQVENLNTFKVIVIVILKILTGLSRCQVRTIKEFLN